jgi:hypothetical protein
MIYQRMHNHKMSHAHALKDYTPYILNHRGR